MNLHQGARPKQITEKFLCLTSQKIPPCFLVDDDLDFFVMKRTLYISSVVLAVIILLLTFWVIGASIQKKTPVSAYDDKPLILVSVAPFSHMVSQIVDDTVNVVTVIPAHVDPHNWEPTYQDMDKLKNATVWFTVGMGFEHPLEKKLLDVNPNLSIINLNDHIEAIETKEDGHQHCESIDTHTWLSPKLDMVIAQFINDTLTNLFPDSRSLYQENLLTLVKELDELDKSIRQSLEPFAGELLVTSHGAYSYFCKEFGLEQVVIEPSEGKEPRVKEISAMVKRLKADKRRIAVILTQPQHSNKGALLLAKELKLVPYMLDPYAPNYIDTMHRLTLLILAENGREAS